VTADNQRAVAVLCGQLDGLPLAIELAAALTRVFSVEQLIERLDNRYQLLAGRGRAALPRHQALRAAVDWSYELCAAREQRAWALLSACRTTIMRRRRGGEHSRDVGLLRELPVRRRVRNRLWC
jgi:predicted ATPase